MRTSIEKRGRDLSRTLFIFYLAALLLWNPPTSSASKIRVAAIGLIWLCGLGLERIQWTFRLSRWESAVCEVALTVLFALCALTLPFSPLAPWLINLCGALAAVLIWKTVLMTHIETA